MGRNKESKTCHIDDWTDFRFKIRDRIDVILANDIFKYQNLNPKMRKNQFQGWLYKVYDKFHNHLTKKERKCLVKKATEPTLPKSIFGNDCLLNFIDFGNLCSNIENFFRWIYSDCKTPGTKVLKRLKHRCMRMNTILDMSV